MRKTKVKNYLIAATLFIELTSGFLFSASAHAGEMCSKIFSDVTKVDTAAYDKLSPNQKRFWDDIVKMLKNDLDYDFQRPVNAKIYAENIDMNHPTAEFYKSLGFEVTAEGTFKTPSAKILFSNLNSDIAKLNRQLKESGFDVQIQPNIFLNLVDKNNQTQNVVLSPLQPFSAPGYLLAPKSNILKTFPFYKLVAGGGFPMGGSESASGLPRSLVMTERNGFNLHAEKANVSDFLHDLSHLAAFVRNPEFAKTYIRVFRSEVKKIERMDSEAQKNYLDRVQLPKYPEWRRNFYFSEAAWIPREGYASRFKKWPLVTSILSGKKSFSSAEITEKISHMDKVDLLRELRDIKSDWWRLFDPLGGAVSDMISYDAFDPQVRSNFIVRRVLGELEAYVKQDRALEGADQRSLVIIFGFLKNAPRMTITSWEYFARVDDWRNSEVYNSLRDMFPREELGSMSEWNKLYGFLYND